MEEYCVDRMRRDPTRQRKTEWGWPQDCEWMQGSLALGMFIIQRWSHADIPRLA